MTNPAPSAADRHVLAADPLLRWDAIAAHALDHHGHAWPGPDAAITAITGAFDAILPFDCGYNSQEGTITSPALPAPPSWAPKWNDPQLLNCVVAAYAAAARVGDLQDIYNEYNEVSVIAPRPA